MVAGISKRHVRIASFPALSKCRHCLNTRAFSGFRRMQTRTAHLKAELPSVIGNQYPAPPVELASSFPPGGQTICQSLADSVRLKCDRQMPCDSCVRKGEPVVCTYSSEAPRHRRTRDDIQRASEAQLRLQRLEEMVTTLMDSNESSSAAPNDALSDKLSIRSLTTPRNWNSCPGHLDVSGSEARYLGATHWESILENVIMKRRVCGCNALTLCRSETYKASLVPSQLTHWVW
jgi:hypothetical protein